MDRVETPEDAALREPGVEPVHALSLTAVEIEALQTGRPSAAHEPEVPGEDALLRGGDPDVDPLENLYNGDEQPGGSMPTPDQNTVDEAGLAAGLASEEADELRSAEELAERRDRHRWDSEPLPPKR